MSRFNMTAADTIALMPVRDFPEDEFDQVLDILTERITRAARKGEMCLKNAFLDLEVHIEDTERRELLQTQNGPNSKYRLSPNMITRIYCMLACAGYKVDSPMLDYAPRAVPPYNPNLTITWLTTAHETFGQLVMDRLKKVTF